MQKSSFTQMKSLIKGLLFFIILLIYYLYSNRKRNELNSELDFTEQIDSLPYVTGDKIRLFSNYSYYENEQDLDPLLAFSI
jgi:hypothetical protein